ncbi:hypothetical protein [Campylobacter gracilis]|uniref:Uncharacterized protein n=2 Tax=Campylobacter TaxID=194 RepID=C8PFP5_9BACT|nr:hypothetical protein [Campylobacter gracilis]AKT93001.1 hypothetical protein CGRAC_1572 [Campylobacter gracilis]EEV18357.1 hypothetical protein CAMGR0001_0687 [Campylobacter gracilis RM3268]UEB44830.1 hypothetical protein LK410_07380 [Campylobacter gracilis]SUW78670.1 Uncharacterised protein [Campylobacter gracilis]
MNFIKYFFSEIFRLFKLLVGIALVPAAGFLIYKLFFAESGLAENYERNRVQILALRDFAREIKPEGVSFDIRFNGDEVSSMRAVNKNKNQSASFYSIDEKTNERAVLKIIGLDFGTFNELKAKAKSANAVGVSIWEGEGKTAIYYKDGFVSEFYEIFGDPADEAVKKDYEIGCDDRFAVDGVVMARDGGATTGFICVDRYGYGIKRK